MQFYSTYATISMIAHIHIQMNDIIRRPTYKRGNNSGNVLRNSVARGIPPLPGQ